MSSDDFKHAGCTGKQTYSFERARSLAKQVSRRHDEPMQPYHCTFCHGWHLGTPHAGMKPIKRQERRA